MILSCSDAAAYAAMRTVTRHKIRCLICLPLQIFRVLYRNRYTLPIAVHINHTRIKVQGHIGPLCSLAADRCLVLGCGYFSGISRAISLPFFDVVGMGTEGLANFGHGSIGDGYIKALTVGFFDFPASILEQIPYTPLTK